MQAWKACSIPLGLKANAEAAFGEAGEALVHATYPVDAEEGCLTVASGCNGVAEIISLDSSGLRAKVGHRVMLW